jgi:hypothetical protein
MMAATALTLMLSAIPVSNKRGWFHMPGDNEFRFQSIRKQDREEDWPFVAESGQMTCAFVLGDRAVYFVSDVDDPTDTPDDDSGHEQFMEEEEPSAVMLASDPIGLMFTMATGRKALKSMKSPQALLSRIAPFIDLGRKLCDQPQGSQLPSGEL